MMTLAQISTAFLFTGLVLAGCGDKDDDTGTNDTDSGSDTDTDPDALSECAEEILAADDEAYETCFASEETYGPCLTCGYWEDADDPGSEFDCVTCPDGYEIDVVYPDCSGACVLEGTAATPLSESDCEAPNLPDEIHDTCFSDTLVVGACEICGFYDGADEALDPADCITCPSGYEIDVIYPDCTGYCVEEGTALLPIASSDCEPVYECVLD